jgi:serine kinase of HPr protein (carbohydrate metabolism regulator)
MIQAQELIVHATAVAIDVAAAAAGAPAADGSSEDRPAGPPLGVLLRGASGRGKSDLALRLIDDGARLIADDRTVLRCAGDGILLSAPAAIAGRLEVRGLCIVPLPAIADVRLVLLIDLVDAGAVERLPLPRTETLCGIAVPLVELDPRENSAPAKVRLAVRAAACGILNRLD